MNSITRLQPLFIIASTLLGMLLGYKSSLGSVSVYMIEPFLMILLFFIFLSIDSKKLTDSFMNPRFTLTAIGINFIWTPAFTFLLGILCFHDSLDLRIGLMMLMVTPCTDWYNVFTRLTNGNVELGASILPLNLLFQILLLPIYLLLFFSSTIHFSILTLLTDVISVLAIPFAASALLKVICSKSLKINACIRYLTTCSDTIQLIFLCLAVIAMFASESTAVVQNPVLLLRMLIPLVVFFFVNFLLVRFIGYIIQMSPSDIISLHFTTLARNSPLSLAIAVATFPDRPLIILALVIGPLIELPALSVISNVMKWLNNCQTI